VTYEDRPVYSSSTGIYQNLLGLPPKSRMIAGAVAIAGGVASTVFLWNRGVVWGLSLFAFVSGLFLFFSGISGMNRQKARAQQLAAFQARRKEWVEAMVEEKRRGGNPVRWMNDQGIHDPEIRSLLMEDVTARLKGQSPPEDPGKRRR
jgi:hypothetical protein